MTTLLTIRQLEKSFTKGNPIVTINELSLQRGSILAVVGESGSGKTTLMRLIAGLETPTRGTIAINDTIVTDDRTFVSPENRQIGMVFQDYALFPHLTLYKNVAYGLSKSQNINARVSEVLQLVGLEGYEERYPHQLSGGQQQRVALARALAPEPELLILDEPFSNLDASLKLQLRNEVFSILKSTNVTALFVTHDIEDAIAIADEIVVLKDGHIKQQGNAETLYKAPENLYIASLFSAVLELNEIRLKSFGITPEKGKRYAIRQCDFLVNQECNCMAQATIVKSAFQGGHYVNTLRVPNGNVLNCITQQKLGGIVNIGFQRDTLLTFENPEHA